MDPSNTPHRYLSISRTITRMLLRVMVMVMVVVMVVVMVSQASPDSYMYSECGVRKKLEIITFNDSVKFWFMKASDDDFKITVEHGTENTVKMQYTNISQNEWLEAKLELSGVPKLYIQGQLQNSTRTITAIQGTRKTVSTENADVLLACPQGWPNRELGPNASPQVRIPLSGEKELLVLMPTVETIVKFTVSGNQRILCLDNSSGTTVVVRKTEAQCNTLRSNSIVTLKFVYKGNSTKILEAKGHMLDNNAKERLLDNFTTNGVKDLWFLRKGLKGPVYIAQCIAACKTDTPLASATLPYNEMTRGVTELPDKDSCKQDLDTLSTVLIVVVVVVVVLLLLLVCYVINLRRQKQLETTYMYAGNNIDPDAGNHTCNAADAVYNGRKVNPQDVTNTGDAVEATNDIYVPYDETLQCRVNYLPNAQK